MKQCTAIHRTIATMMAATAILFGAARSLAAPGDLDPTFGGNYLNVPGDSFGARALFRQNDEKLVAAGYYNIYPASTYTAVILRYNADLTLDKSFGTQGMTTGPYHVFPFTLIQQGDGKFVVAGQRSASFPSTSEFALIRYTADGAFDTTFGSGGIVYTDVGASHDYGYGLALQSDGRLVVAGRAYPAGGAIVRYNSDGTLDTTFAGTGKVTTALADELYSVVVQADGKLVAAGQKLISGDNDFVVIRFNSDGSLDTGFGGTGAVTTDIVNDDRAYTLIQQLDGKLVAGGSADVSGATKMALARYNLDGSPDTAFGGGDGIVAVDAQPYFTFDQAQTIIQQADGKLAVGGSPFMVRFNADGTIDASLAGDGTVTEAETGWSYVSALVQEADGSYVGLGDQFGLVRVTPDGGFEHRLHNGISANADPFYSYNGMVASDMRELDDGELLFAGSYWLDATNFDFYVLRLKPDGNLDTSFGSNGTATANFGMGQQGLDAITVQQDGKIVAVGSAQAANGWAFALARFTANGLLDGTFGSGGKVLTDFGGPSSDSAIAVLQQADGKIIAAGYTDTGGTGDVALARYDANGMLDSTFGSGGKVVTPIGSGIDGANAIAQQPDGKLVVAGVTVAGDGFYDFAVLRYNIDGSLDTTFGGGDGIATIGIGASDDVPYDLELLPDGKIVIAGSAAGVSDERFALARFNNDGTLDTSFGSGGTVIGPIGSVIEVARQRDGKLLMGGTYYDPNFSYFQLVRFTAEGDLDMSFGDAGVAREYSYSDIGAATLLRDSRAIIGGAYQDGFYLARFLTSYCGPQAADLTCKASGSSKLKIKQGATDSADQVLFKWKKGDDTTTGELADPTTTSEYSLCVYDDNGLRLQMTALAGGTCGTQACWSTKTKGYNYLDKTLATDGIKKIKLQAGAAGKAQVQLTAHGDMVPDLNPPQPFIGNVAAELVNEETGTCFVAEYTPADMKKNDAAQFQAKK